MSKQDRPGARTPADIERKYMFEKRFKEAKEYTDKTAQDFAGKLDEKLDQTEIFNRLTNNGESQGLYLGEDGQLYINASYLVTGILKSLDGTTFYLDLVKGVLKGQFTEFSISGKTVDEIAEEKASEAQQNAEKYASDALNNQTQTDVYNKLTNNGESEGIYFVNGQLYINASYLAAGVLKSADSTTFNLDIANNKLKIAGKSVSWKENDDGEFVLVGE